MSDRTHSLPLPPMAIAMVHGRQSTRLGEYEPFTGEISVTPELLLQIMPES